MGLIELTSLSQFESYIRQSKPTFVMFTSNTCPPCQRMKQVIKQSYQQYTIYQADFSLIQATSHRPYLVGLPLFAKYVSGKRVGSFMGADESRLRRMLQSSANSNGSEWNIESNQNHYFKK